MKLNENRMKASIWLKTRRKLKKQPTVKNRWTATKNQLIDDRVKIGFSVQTEPTKQEIMEYRIYNDLIALCANNE